MASEEQFKALTISGKAHVLFQEGEFVMSIRYYGYKINLYLYQNIYFEVFYHHLNDRIEKIIELYSESTRMKFYADQVRLPKMA